MGERGFGITCFMEKILTILWCLRKLSILLCLGCNWGEEGIRGKVIRKTKRKGVWSHRVKKNFFLLSVFYFCFHLVWWSPGMVIFGKNLDVVLYVLFWRRPQILVVFKIFCSVWVWLGWFEKNWMCFWALTCGRKWRFSCHLFWLIVCICKFFSLDCVGFHRCNVCCNLCMGWSICLLEKWFRCWSVLWCLWWF